MSALALRSAVKQSLLVAGMLSLLTSNSLAQSPEYTLDDPADDLPAQGYSLFDKLFSQPTDSGYEYDVPYPFESLLQRLSKLQSGNVVQVLIPMGRSLHRETARPHFFRYPRVLLALDEDSTYRTQVRNRLFLGYQEKADVIEVISYNEDAGRFEFQVVHNYAEGVMPIVRYANRALCMSCHQNAGPIFPLAPWQETNFNNVIADRVKQHHVVYQGVPTDSLSSRVSRFDIATDKANLFSVYQQFWQQACGGNSETGVRCRASIFLAMMYYRLASFSPPRLNSNLISKYFLPVLKRNWEYVWPKGLAIPVADLKDRLPNVETLDFDLGSDTDPLSLRSSRSSWGHQRAADLSVLGLSESFLLDRDIQLLNDHLVRLARKKQLKDQIYSGKCRLTHRSYEHVDKSIGIRCKLQQSSSKSSLTAYGELLPNEGGQLQKEISWLYINVDNMALRTTVSGNVGRLEHTGDSVRLDLFKQYAQINSRLWDNRLIAGFELRLTQPSWFSKKHDIDAGEDQASATVTIADDLVILENAVEELVEDTLSGSFDGFTDKPFQGIELTNALFKKLGINLPDETELQIPAGLPVEADTHSNKQLKLTGQPEFPAMVVLNRYCIDCHSQDTVSPPGFLYGSTEQVKSRLRRCAPSIAYRLRLWELDDSQRSASPMPPEAYFASEDVDSDWWIGSDELQALRIYAESLAGEPGGALIANNCLGEHTYSSKGKQDINTEGSPLMEGHLINDAGS